MTLVSSLRLFVVANCDLYMYLIGNARMLCARGRTMVPFMYSLLQRPRLPLIVAAEKMRGIHMS